MSSALIRRRATRLPRGSLGVACAVAASALGVTLAPSPAGAAVTVNSPPANGHSIIVFPQRDFIHADGYAATDRLTVEDIRNGVVIASAAGVTPVDDPTTALYDGMFDLNHLGVPCWDNVTPDILPGDVIRITDQNGVADETPTANVTVTQPATDTGGGTIVVKGTAADAAGGQLPAGSFEARIIAKNLRFDANNKRDIRATPVYDGVGLTTWTATLPGLDAHDVGIAVGGESRDLWLGRAPGASANALGSPIESTIYEYAALGGPAAGCAAAPQARYAVTSSAPASLNAATNASDLVLSGASQDATSVTITLTDSTGAQVTSVPATPTPATGAQTWSVTIPAAQHNTLAQGPLTAAGSYTLAAGSLTGATKTILKDTVAPGSPVATPPGGTYTTVQAVTLSNPENLPMYTTVDGTTPSAASARYTGQISITATQTLRAVAIDAAGNPSTVAVNPYTIVTAAKPGAPASASATAGDATATVSWTPPASDGGAAISSYRVHAVTVGTQPADQTVTAGTTATFTGLANLTQYAFDVFATNVAGEGLPARTNAVTPAPKPVPPGAPTIGTATAGANSATVTFTPPANNGGSPITGYTVKATDTVSGTWVSAPAPAGASSGAVSGLQPGRSYRLSVTATNAAGTSLPSADSNIVTIPAAPTAPAAPVIGVAAGGVTTDTVVSATARWTPGATGGSAITSYLVTADLYTGTTLTSSTTKTAGAAARTLKFTGLVTGKTYKFRVRAVNAVGTSKFSASSGLVTAR